MNMAFGRVVIKNSLSVVRANIDGLIRRSQKASI